MNQDDIENGEEQPPERPDPSFIKELEDDALWSQEEARLNERRVDRARRRSGEAAYGTPKRREQVRVRRRPRLVAVGVLVAAALVITMTGLEVKSSMFGSSGSEKTVPFSLLPLPNSPATSTTQPISTSSPTTTTSEGTPTTTTTAPVAAVAAR